MLASCSALVNRLSCFQKPGCTTLIETRLLWNVNTVSGFLTVHCRYRTSGWDENDDQKPECCYDHVIQVSHVPCNCHNLNKNRIGPAKQDANVGHARLRKDRILLCEATWIKNTSTCLISLLGPWCWMDVFCKEHSTASFCRLITQLDWIITVSFTCCLWGGFVGTLVAVVQDQLYKLETLFFRPDEVTRINFMFIKLIFVCVKVGLKLKVN